MARRKSYCILSLASPDSTVVLVGRHMWLTRSIAVIHHRQQRVTSGYGRRAKAPPPSARPPWTRRCASNGATARVPGVISSGSRHCRRGRLSLDAR